MLFLFSLFFPRVSFKMNNILRSVKQVAGDVEASSTFRTQLIEAFDVFAISINYSGQTLDNKIMGDFKYRGVAPPKAKGHKNPNYNFNNANHNEL